MSMHVDADCWSTQAEEAKRGDLGYRELPTCAQQLKPRPRQSRLSEHVIVQLLQMSLYNDQPLQNPDSIQLLTLQPAGNDAAIEVSVTTLWFSTRPDFIVSSYTGGDLVDEQRLA